MSEHRLCIVLTTESSLERAESLAEALLERRLVACASLFPVRSRYRWAGRMERSDEVQLLLKTSPERLNALQAAVLELHGYDTPEWIHWHAAAGGSYGEWCAAQLSPDAGPPDGSATPGGGGPAG